MDKNTIIPSVPIHPLASLLFVVLDNLWLILELETTLTIAAIPALIPMMLAIGLTCGFAVVLIERFISKEEWGASIAKGLAIGIITGVPYAVMGTAAGALLLGWAGMHQAEKLLKGS